MAALILVVPLSGCFEAPPQVVSLDPNNGSTNVAGDMPISVGFDQRVDPRSVMKRFSITPSLPRCDLGAAAGNGGRSTPCRIRWSDGDTKFVVEHQGSPFTPLTKYTLSLSAGFVDDHGVANSLDHKWELTSGAAPKLNASTPSDGAEQVPTDSALVLKFSTYMTVSTTSGAVSLTPPVPDTRVVVNRLDHGRFLVLPGRLLRPNTAYTLRVAGSATDEHGLALEVPTPIRFRTGGVGHGGHAVILAGVHGGPAASVYLGALQADQPGEPASAPQLLQSTACSRLACGPLGFGDPLQSYREAAVSPDVEHLAVVATDQTVPGSPPSLELTTIAATDAPPQVLARDASQVAWSPDSTRLAYEAADRVHIRTIATGADSVLPPGPPLSGPPIWSPDGTTMVLSVRGEDGIPRVELADATLHIRYPLPALPPPVTAPALSPSGDILAVQRLEPTAAGTWLLHLSGGDSSPRRLGSDLAPIAWLDEGTLLARATSSSTPQLVRVSVAGGDRTPVTGAPAAADADLVVAAGGRQIAYLTRVTGVANAVVANGDGSNPIPMTTFTAPDGVEALWVRFLG